MRQKYITKPTVIEAEIFNNSEDQINNYEMVKEHCPLHEGFVQKILTKQGYVKVNKGDYLITLEDGETYPCSKEVFEKKYKKIEE